MMLAFENRLPADKKMRLKAVETAAFMMQEFQMKLRPTQKVKVKVKKVKVNKSKSESG